jgi:sugar phosphate isomerase/epimerase
MTRPLSLAHLTVLSLAPPAMIRLAAWIGYASVGLRLVAVTETTPGYPLMDDPALLRNTRAALADTGVTVQDIEFVKITPDFDPAAWERFLAAGAEIGARHVICAPYDPDLGRLSDRLAGFGERAAAHGLSAVLEFFPWTVVPDLVAASSVVGATGRADIGILVDMLHFDRSGSRLSDLRALDPARLPFVHLCDAPRQPSYTTEDLLHAGRAERLPPGEGGIDLAAILGCLPAMTPAGLEVPMTALTAAEGPEAVARRAYDGARRVLRGMAG